MRSTDPKDSSRRYFRSADRIFSQDGQWYIAAREGEIGPFRSHQAATRAAARYVRECSELERFQQESALETGPQVHRLAIVPMADEPMLTPGAPIPQERRQRHRDGLDYPFH